MGRLVGIFRRLLRRVVAPRVRAVAVVALALVVAAALPAVSAHAAGMVPDDGGAIAGDGAMGSAAMGEVGADASGATAAAAKPSDEMHVDARLRRLVGSSGGNGSDGLDREEMARVFPGLLEVSTDPASINVGIECSMKDLCGIDPCTCGKPDAWGHCACAGFRQLTPTITVSSSNEGVAGVAEVFGHRWIVPRGPGSAAITVRAELQHYRTAEYRFRLVVVPFGLVDALLIVAAIALAGFVALAILLSVRVLARLVRRVARARAARRAQIAGLRAAHPVTWRDRLDAEDDVAGRRSRRRAAPAAHPRLHEAACAARDALPALCAALAVLTVLVPVSTAAVPSVSVFNLDYTHEQLKYQLFSPALAPAVTGACAVAGIAFAICLFHFVLARRAVTARFSLGIARCEIFAIRFGVGLVCCAIAVAVPFAVSFALNAASLGVYDGEVAACLYVAAGFVLTAAVSMALSTIAILLAGSPAEATVLTVALIGGVSVLAWTADALCSHLLAGFSWGVAAYNQVAPVEPSILERAELVNPALFFLEEGASKQAFSVLHPVYYPEPGNAALLLGWTAVLIALMALAACLLVFRRGEQAEIAGMNPAISAVGALIVSLAGFAGALSALVAAGTTAALASGCAALAFVSAALLFGPLRGRVPARRVAAGIAAELALVLAVAGVVHGGALGFAAYVPGDGDGVASVEVSVIGDPSRLTSGFAGVTHGSAFYAAASASFDDAASIKTVERAHRELVADAAEPVARDGVYAYDVLIRYTFRDGRVVSRYYDRARMRTIAGLAGLGGDAATLGMRRAIITGDESGLSKAEAATIEAAPAWACYRRGGAAIADGTLQGARELQLSDADRAGLLVALADDVAAGAGTGAETASAAPVRAVLMFSTSLEADMRSMGYSFNAATTYLTDAYGETLAWLRAHGHVAGAGEAAAPEAVAPAFDELALVRDDASLSSASAPVSRWFAGYRSASDDDWWYAGVAAPGSGSPRAVSISDASEISRLAGSLRPGCLMTGGWLVRAHVRGETGYTYLYLPSSALDAQGRADVDALFG